MRLPSGVTGRLGTPMKETGGLSQPLRSLNRPNKTKQQNNPGIRPLYPADTCTVILQETQTANRRRYLYGVLLVLRIAS